jgi:hypothetical protein
MVNVDGDFGKRDVLDVIEGRSDWTNGLSIINPILYEFGRWVIRVEGSYKP